MNVILNILIAAIVFFLMEFVARFTHKYVMHGFMREFHEDHPQTELGFSEKNDVFFLIFASPSMLLTYMGTATGNDWKLFAGLGVLLCETCYFLVHDMLIHRRFKSIRHPYLKALIKAHYEHHKYRSKERGESFGMPVVSRKYIADALSSCNKKKQPA